MCLLVRNLQNTLPQILAFQHTQKAINGVIHTRGDVVDRLETPVGDPFGDVVVTLRSPASDVGVEHDEALVSESLADDGTVVLETVGGAGAAVVIGGDGPACYNAAEVFHLDRHSRLEGSTGASESCRV